MIILSRAQYQTFVYLFSFAFRRHYQIYCYDNFTVFFSSETMTHLKNSFKFREKRKDQEERNE